MSEFTMTIDGKAVPVEESFGVINPATEEVFAECPKCTPEQLDSAMESAKRAFPEWREDEAARRQLLRHCAERLQSHAEELGELQTREQGKPLKNSIGEIQFSAWWFEQTAALEIPCNVLQDDEKVRIEVRRHPLGVVAGITPWNFPVAMAVWKIAPALLAGNTMVLKPSPYTPLSTLKLGEILRDALPPGVLNIVSGGDALGAQMTRHPTVRKISFTGSVETGKLIAQAAAPDLKRLVLELGGNDAAIVLPDVEPKSFAPKIFWEVFGNCGQVCIAIKRLYVHESLFEPLLRELVELAEHLKVGNGLDPDTEMGPLNNKAQLERVIELVEDARQAGARIVTGGHRLERRGYFYAPTLVTGIREGTRLVDEEQFGPALPVMPFKDVDEVIERANATHYGLGGRIWTNDPERGTELAARLECGLSRVNEPDGFITPFVPFGGAKWSGIGYQNGAEGLEAYTQLQTIGIAKT